MKRIGVFLLLIFITHYAYADYITQNITGGCDSQTLNTIGNATYLEPVFALSNYTCPSGYYLPANTEGCIACTYGHTCAGGIFTFNENSDQGIVISTYTCSSGQFLPANVDGCRSCPSGYTCSGGTFEFNETVAQGITVKDTLTANASNACSSNVLNTFGNTAYLEPVFTPNTVSLTWDDGVGNTQSTSCTYDGLINLPPEPAQRAGYRFVGWKLEVNNE